jgi:GT2 family glycosyltransferase
MNGIFEINMINGCCLLMNMPIFEKIGLIDERFFLLFEDADLGRRTLAAGYPMYCDTSARIKYKESRGFGGRRTPIKTYYSVRNFFLFTEKHNSLRARVSLARYVGWTIWRTAEAAGSPPKSWNDVFRWLLSADIYAKATRMGLRDYLLRRFGRVSKRDESTLRAHREIREPG